MDKKYKYVRLELIDGTETGWIEAYFKNEDPIVIKIPAGKLKDNKDLAPLNNSGFYIIVGENEEGKNAMYIGQSSVRDNGKSFMARLDEHNRYDKNKIYPKYRYIITKMKANKIDDNYNATQLNYLERKLIQEAISINAKKKNKYIINNGQKPNPDKEPIDDESRAECDDIFDKILRLLYAVGCDVFSEEVKSEKYGEIEEEPKNIGNDITKNSINSGATDSKKTITYKFFGETHVVNRWVDLLNDVMKILINMYPDRINELAEKNFTIHQKEGSIPFITFSPTIGEEKTRKYYNTININGNKCFYFKNLDQDNIKTFVHKLVGECCGSEYYIEIF